MAADRPQQERTRDRHCGSAATGGENPAPESENRAPCGCARNRPLERGHPGDHEPRERYPVGNGPSNEMGGGGTAVTPGWLLRAGLASCVTTRIAMAAAVAGIELTELEVVATSQSDARGLLGMADADGQPVSAGPRDLQLHVKITATDGTSAERLRSLVEQSHGCSPVSCAVQDATAIELLIEVG